MENRTLIAIVLSVFVLIVSQYFLQQQEPVRQAAKPPVEKAEKKGESAKQVAVPLAV